VKKEDQQPLRKLIEEIPIFSLTKETLEEVLPFDRDMEERLVEVIKVLKI
jgi:hypothetical protein